VDAGAARDRVAAGPVLPGTGRPPAADAVLPGTGRT